MADATGPWPLLGRLDLHRSNPVGAFIRATSSSPSASFLMCSNEILSFSCSSRAILYLYDETAEVFLISSWQMTFATN